VGLLKHLLFWPVTGPKYLTEFSLEKVSEVVRDNLTDDTPIKEELLILQLRLESGEIDDDEYVREEARLMAALRDVRHWREQYGMGLAGGPVRVAQSPREEEAEVVEEAAPRQPQVMSGDAKVDIQLDWGDE
jgi:hypothetical protein